MRLREATLRAKTTKNSSACDHRLVRLHVDICSVPGSNRESAWY
jgi:hypothetical protein